MLDFYLKNYYIIQIIMGICWNTPAYYPGVSNFNRIVDADPITPGFQATPGIVTPVGPPSVRGLAPIGGPILSRPPIYSAPYSPPVVVSPVITPTFGAPAFGPTGGFASSYGYSNNFGLAQQLDLDPITPGQQFSPGIVSATGPTFIR